MYAHSLPPSKGRAWQKKDTAILHLPTKTSQLQLKCFIKRLPPAFVHDVRSTLEDDVNQVFLELYKAMLCDLEDEISPRPPEDTVRSLLSRQLLGEAKVRGLGCDEVDKTRTIVQKYSTNR